MEQEPTLSFNTIIAFYDKYQTCSIIPVNLTFLFKPMLVIIFMMFTSAASKVWPVWHFMGACRKEQEKDLGNYEDMVRITTRILIPWSPDIRPCFDLAGPVRETFGSNITVETIHGNFRILPWVP